MKASDMINPPKAAKEIGAGSPDLTIRMKKAYDNLNIQQQTDGADTAPWADWLDEQGYGLDAKGLVFKKK